LRLRNVVTTIHGKYLNNFLLISLSIALFLALFILFIYKIPLYAGNYERFHFVNTTPCQPKLALIIDDFGQNRDGVKEMLEINRHLTFAVIPFMEFSSQDANRAHEKGYEVIVHLPMQSQKEDNPAWLGPRPVKIGLKGTEVKRIVVDSINSIPYAVGLNIHMGALSSENNRIMSDVMSVVKEKGLYFVDSVTSQKTVCRAVAKKLGAKFAERNVFLEKSIKYKNKDYIKKQLMAAGDMALKHGYAVAIGHVGPVGGRITAEAIKEAIPELEEKGIRLIYVSELLNSIK